MDIFVSSLSMGGRQDDDIQWMFSEGVVLLHAGVHS